LIAEIAPLDVDVLVTVGPEGNPAALGDVPENVHVERFVAQSAVLPLVDLIVHHGGTGTVLSGLEVGLPQLLLPQGADQCFNAEILTTTGAARALPNDAHSWARLATQCRRSSATHPSGTPPRGCETKLLPCPRLPRSFPRSSSWLIRSPCRTSPRTNIQTTWSAVGMGHACRSMPAFDLPSGTRS
jgi:hypothetical protein